MYTYVNIISMNKRKTGLLPIGEAANYLGVARTTLRRWNKAGKLEATYVSPGKRLYYSTGDLEKKTKGLVKSAFDWASAKEPFAPPVDWFCPTSDVFRARLERLYYELISRPGQRERASLITSAVGEIGNNSYDHNLGNWPDILGALFAYDLGKHVIVLSDRGVGVLATLRKIKPELSTHEEALKVAFTEIITGRSPEHRGNGLKYVRQALELSRAQLVFQSGNACLRILKNETELEVTATDTPTRGCFAIIHF